MYSIDTVYEDTARIRNARSREELWEELESALLNRGATAEGVGPEGLLGLRGWYREVEEREGGDGWVVAVIDVAIEAIKGLPRSAP